MSVIDEYLASNATSSQQKELNRIRKLALSMVPDAEETISYGVPTLKYKGTYLLYFAAFKNHMSIFPGGEIIEAVKNQLDGYTLNKGTIQFTEDKPLSDSVIKDLISHRLDVINQKKR